MTIPPLAPMAMYRRAAHSFVIAGRLASATDHVWKLSELWGCGIHHKHAFIGRDERARSDRVEAPAERGLIPLFRWTLVVCVGAKDAAVAR